MKISEIRCPRCAKQDSISILLGDRQGGQHHASPHATLRGPKHGAQPGSAVEHEGREPGRPGEPDWPNGPNGTNGPNRPNGLFLLDDIERLLPCCRRCTFAGAWIEKPDVRDFLRQPEAFLRKVEFQKQERRSARIAFQRSAEEES